MHRSLLLVLLGFYCFLVYSVVRPLFGTFGFDLATTVKSVLVVLVLTGFIVWLIPLVDLPLMIFNDRMPRARNRKGQCPGCGYPKPGMGSTVQCPECGTLTGAVPPRWKPTTATLTRFMGFLCIAILLGSGIGEWRILADEANFQEQASTRTYTYQGESFIRNRAWPSSHATMHYTVENGPESQTILQSRRIRKWMRNDSTSRDELSSIH